MLNARTYTYDKFSHITSYTDSATGFKYIPIYEKYANGIMPDECIKGITLDGKYTYEYEYDTLHRITAKKLTLTNNSVLLRNEYSYLNGVGVTTGIIGQDKHKLKGAVLNTYTYTYDDMGNIATISDSAGLIVGYAYDGMDHLVVENNLRNRKRYTYCYDCGGNIREKHEYDLDSDGVAINGKHYVYTYDDTNRDILLSYNGEACSNYRQGLPFVYRGKELGWNPAYKLVEFDGTTFEYSSVDGRRIKKNDITYIYEDGRLVRENRDGYRLQYFYDDSGIIGFRVDNYVSTPGEYYFEKNIQGDVIAIYNPLGVCVAKYHYDAWGKPLAILNGSNEDVSSDAMSIANINPIRYRGYYYDVETGLYYLNTRYYDPETGRFLNADNPAYLDSPPLGSGYNLFAYCNNNPVMSEDPDGNWSLPNWAKVAIGAVAIAGLAVATVCTGGAAGVIAGAALTGAISGGVSCAISGAISGAIEDGWQGALDGACTGFMSGTLIGGATGALTSGLSVATGAVKVVGSAQKTGTALHRAASNIEAGKMALNPIKYSKITLNRCLNTAGLSGRRIPDVIGVSRNGSSILVEVVSKSQTVEQMRAKCISMTNANPGAAYKVIGWAATVCRFIQ